MDSQTQRRLQRFIDTKWKHGACPVCESDSWQVGGDIGELPTSDMYATDLVAAGSVYPLYPIFCTTCGYTLLFNAHIAGLVGPEQPQAGEASPEENLP
jgi:hypothetical protein